MVLFILLEFAFPHTTFGALDRGTVVLNFFVFIHFGNKHGQHEIRGEFGPSRQEEGCRCATHPYE
jgi:hypothetical protein